MTYRGEEWHQGYRAGKSRGAENGLLRIESLTAEINSLRGTLVTIGQRTTLEGVKKHTADGLREANKIAKDRLSIVGSR